MSDSIDDFDVQLARKKVRGLRRAFDRSAHGWASFLGGVIVGLLLASVAALIVMEIGQ